MSITNNYRNTRWRIRSAGAHRNWILRVVREEGRRAGSVDFIFADDETVKLINAEFLNHNYYTDVITFDYSSGGVISGEIYIATGVVSDNAAKFGAAVAEEMRRVMIHAVLHLCGYGDSTADEAANMRRLEERYLELYRDGFQI